MKRKCEHCQSEYECKRLTKKYCSDNCKQLAYFKRNGFQQVEKSIVVCPKTDSKKDKVQDKKTLQEKIMDEIADRVLQLIKLREKEEIKISEFLCKPEAFSIKRIK